MATDLRNLEWQYGVLNERSEWKQWLHIFLLNGADMHLNENRHAVFPWPMTTIAPDFELLAAHWNLNQYQAGWPPGWNHFWEDLNALRQSKRMISDSMSGP